METVKAMVVDDSRVMRMMVMKSLRETQLAEFVFSEAEDGEDALGKFGDAQPDIMFVDWNMPKMCGIDFVRAIRSVEENASIPIVMVTSERTMGKIGEALDSAGASEYICKLFTVEQLTSELGVFIEAIEASRQETSGGFFGRFKGRK